MYLINHGGGVLPDYRHFVGESGSNTTLRGIVSEHFICRQLSLFNLVLFFWWLHLYFVSFLINRIYHGKRQALYCHYPYCAGCYIL